MTYFAGDGAFFTCERSAGVIMTTWTGDFSPSRFFTCLADSEMTELAMFLAVSAESAVAVTLMVKELASLLAVMFDARASGVMDSPRS